MFNVHNSKTLDIFISFFAYNSSIHEHNTHQSDHMNETDLVDIWRHQNPQRLLFKWGGKRRNPVFSRIDFFLI